MIRILLFVALVYFAISLPSPLFLMAACLYVLLYNRTYELLLLGALLDAVFGGLTMTVLPFYLLLMLTVVILGEYARPWLRWQS